MTQQRVERPNVGWGFWLRWVLASTGGLGVGWVVVRVLDWTLARAVGSGVVWAVGWGFGLGGVVSGALVGMLQWLALREHVTRAGWWVLANIGGFAVGWNVGGAVADVVLESVSSAVGRIVFESANGFVVGAITGITLVWLLRQPVSEE